MRASRPAQQPRSSQVQSQPRHPQPRSQQQYETSSDRHENRADNDGRFPALATLAKDAALRSAFLALRQGLAVGVVHLQMEQLQVVDVVHLDVVLLASTRRRTARAMWIR